VEPIAASKTDSSLEGVKRWLVTSFLPWLIDQLVFNRVSFFDCLVRYGSVVL
jgi:hypothetical protein